MAKDPIMHVAGHGGARGATRARAFAGRQGAPCALFHSIAASTRRSTDGCE